MIEATRVSGLQHCVYGVVSVRALILNKPPLIKSSQRQTFDSSKVYGNLCVQ